MKKTELINELFEKWESEHEFDIFCRDGIVDEKEFGNDIPEMLFLLKDANAENKEGSDVCKNLLETANGKNTFGKMWKVICMWAKIAENPNARYSDCCDDNRDIKDSLRKYLEKIAVVNVSKEHGKGVNNQDELNSKLNKSVKEYYDYTREEINIIDPSIVICCGTYHHILDEYGVYDKTLPSGARYFNADGRIFLEMCHPGSNISYPALFAYFKEVFSDFDL